MSALHYGRVEAAANPAGRLVYTGTAVEHPLPGWDKPATRATVTRLIPRQRCTEAADVIGDLRDLNPIPTLGAFVRELLATETHEEV